VNTSQIVALIVVVIAVALAVGIGIWFAGRTKRSKTLREKFGPEYDLTMEKTGNKRATEATLGEREKRISQLDIRDLNPTERDRYHKEWTEIQANFVDEPSKSLEKANLLVTEVMMARGFPVADFEQRAADVSVLYPNVVTNYRHANVIALKNQSNEASTEELRQAMVHYRSLFDELLGTVKVDDVATEDKKEVTQ